MRKLKRSVARANMLRQGYTQINKKKYGSDQSFFARNWRKFL